MKKTKIIPIVARAAILGLAACNGGGGGNESQAESQQQESQPESQTQQEKITISGLPKTVTKGDTFTLTASVEGVTWKSSDESIATVSATGSVTAVGGGAVSITASKEGYKDAKVNFTVQLVAIQVEAAGSKTSLLAGETVQLTASQAGVTWASQDASVATVSDAGLVTAVKFGTTTISATKDGFKTGTITISVVRPAANLKIDMTTDADHYAADGWWGGKNSWGMEQGGGATPVTYTQTYGQDDTEPDYYLGYFGAGDKETVKFTSDKAVKAEIVVNMGNSDALVLAETVKVKLNDKEVALTGIELAAHEGQSGNELTFGDVSLGEQNLKVGENVLEFEMLGEAAPFLNDITLYAGSAKLALVAPTPKVQIEVQSAELEVIEEQTVAIVSAVTGLSYVSADEATATVDEKGIVTGVKPGIVNITVKKDGMYSVRVKVTVSAKPVAGQILIEAESAAEIGGDGAVYSKTEDGGSSGGDTVHSGSAYISAWQGDGATLTYSFESDKAQTMTLSVVGSASMMASEDFVLKDVMTIKLNDAEVTISDEAKFPAPENYQAQLDEAVLGEVTVKAGTNTFVVELTGLPTLDVFKLSAKA